MPTDLATLVEAFQREVAVPGAFDSAFPDTSPTDIIGCLMDAFGEAQLDGWFGSYTLDVATSSVADAGNTDPLTNGLSLAGQALIVLYAGMRMVRNQMMNTKSQVRYKAGPVEYETATSATVLTQMLKDLAARRQELLNQVRYARRVAVIDGYWGREATFHSGELPTLWARALTC